MAIIIISMVAFVFMLLFPILFSLFFLRQSSGEVLAIDQSKIKDPRYFVKSFTGLFNRKWADYDGSGEIFLSKAENILEADESTEFPQVCNSIVYVQNNEFRPPEGISFEREVYTLHHACLNGIGVIRAICSKKDLILGKGTRVLRWADAEGALTVSDDCDLGISASSTTKITIGNNCCFRRLYAPDILFGQAPGEESDYHFQNVDLGMESLEIIRNIKYVNDDLTDDAGVLTGSIITTHNITVLDCLAVKGHIRSHKSIRICDHAVVLGNLFSEGNIYLGENCRVYGSVFTQGDLYAESGVTIGQPGKTKSVIARGKIIFSQNCRIYGYVNSETGGKCCPDSLEKIDENILPGISPAVSKKSYLPVKYRPALINTAVLLAVVTASLFGTILHGIIQQNERLFIEKREDAKRLIYGPDGKPGGGKLQTEPIMITDAHIYFEDRVLERYHYDSKKILRSSEVLKGINVSLPDGVNKYLMVAPMRIALEGDKYQKYSDDIIGSITEVYHTMPSDVITIDALGALSKHRDEYLFFRTDEVWTALGAYYAAKEYCKQAAIKMIVIEKYRENRFENYLGTMRVLPHAQSLHKYPDYVSYYIMDGAANEQIITTRRGKGDYRTYKSPAVALSRRGYDIFVGPYYSHSILSGDLKSGKTLMIVGDQYGKALATWLTPYFESVILVNPKYFEGGSKEFWQLFTKYQISDFLLIEYVQNLGNDTFISKLRELYSTP